MVILEAGAHQLLFNAEEDAQKPAQLTIFFTNPFR